MPRVWSSKQAGFSAVEVLLAAAVFGVLVTAIIGALVYGRASTATAGERNRANLLAEEGLEAVRNIRDASYANLTDGTYGMVLSGGVWTLSGSSDVNGVFTRQVTIAANGTNRKLITSRVSWPQGSTTSQTEVATQFSNWAAAMAAVKTWANAIQQGSVDVTGTVAGYRIATQGDYAYVIRNATTANFYVINISNPAAPTVVGSLNVAASPTNIAVNGNFAYLSTTNNSAEMQVINITTPTAPTISGSYDASGTADGYGVRVVGTTVYLVRNANASTDEFVIINAATPAIPTRTGGFGFGSAMYDVYVNGTVAYIATASDTREVLVLNIATPTSIVASGTGIDLTGTTNATTIDGYGTVLMVGQGTALRTLNTATPLTPTISGALTMGGTVMDVAADGGHQYAHVGTNGANTEFQVVNLSTPATPTLLRTVNVTGTAIANGVAYNATKDVVPAALSLTNMEVVIFAPN